MGYLIELTLAYNTQNNPPSYHSFHPRHLQQQQQQPRRRGGRYTESPPRGAPTSPALSITTPVDAQFKLWSIYIYTRSSFHTPQIRYSSREWCYRTGWLNLYGATSRNLKGRAGYLWTVLIRRDYIFSV